MFRFFANIFGYLLSIINNIVGNYGLAINNVTIVYKTTKNNEKKCNTSRKNEGIAIQI